MRNVLEAIWWWTRLIVLCLIGVYILALLFKNSGQVATLWYWPHMQSDNTPIITIVLVSFLAGGVVSITAWALTSAMVTYRRTREERRERGERESREEMERKARMLRVKPAPTPIVRRPAEGRPRMIPSVSLDATPDELEDEPRSAGSESDGPDFEPRPTVELPAVPLPMPPVPTAARSAEAAVEPSRPAGLDLSMPVTPLIDEPVAAAPPDESAEDRGPRDERAKRILGVRLPPPPPPPAGG